MKTKRTVIIGLDGVPFGLIKDLSINGTMPKTQRLIEEGIFRKMESSIPEVSSVAWSSILTGCNPAEHGIFGFTDFANGSYRLYFPNFDSLKQPPFWEQIQARSVIINVPSTYPVRKINGVHISGFVSVEFERSVYPKDIIPKLKNMDYRFDVDSEKAHKSMELFFADLDRTMKSRISAYRYLWRHPEWKIFMLVFTGSDRLMHFLWNAYEDKNHIYHEKFLDYFKQADEIIGEIADNIDARDNLIMLSDHGFGPLDKNVYINHVLYKEGFLKFQDASEPKWTNIGNGAKAFALDPARIYINLKDKYPQGNVDKNDTERVLKDLEDVFCSLKIENKKVIKNIYRKEQLYTGPLLDKAPDLILVGNEGFNLKASLKINVLTDKDIFTGRHTQDDAFLYIRNSSYKDMIPARPTVYDIKNIIWNLR